jgi:arginine transport system substrate-binding protein
MKGSITKLILVCGLLIFYLPISANMKIRFGMTYFYPPFVSSSQSSYIHGFDIDVAKAICQNLNAECTFTVEPFNQLFADLQQNKFDAIMGALSITPQRQASITFTQPYLKSNMSYVTLTANNNLNPDNLQGQKIGVQKDSTFYNYINQKYANKIKLVTYNTNEELINALSNKEIDVVAIDTPVAKYWVGYSTGLFKLLGAPISMPFDQGYGIGVKKDNAALLKSLNNALLTIMRNGTFDKIKQHYFPNEAP